MENYNLEKISLEYQMIFSEPLDSRGPLQVDDGLVEGDSLEMFKAEVADKLSKAAAGVVDAGTVVPSFDEIIGITDAIRDGSFVVAKHVEVSPGPEMTLAKSGLSTEDQEFARWHAMQKSMWGVLDDAA